MNDELVDLVLVDECPDQCSAAHHPDVLAPLSPEMFRERRWLFTDEFHSRCPDQASRISGKDVVFGLRLESGSVLKAELICLSPKHDRIDRSAECSHAVVTSRPWTIQPINAAVGASNEAVSTCGDVYNNLSHVYSRRSNVRAEAGPTARAKTFKSTATLAPGKSAKRYLLMNFTPTAPERD